MLVAVCAYTYAQPFSSLRQQPQRKLCRFYRNCPRLPSNAPDIFIFIPLNRMKLFVEDNLKKKKKMKMLHEIEIVFHKSRVVARKTQIRKGGAIGKCSSGRGQRRSLNATSNYEQIRNGPWDRLDGSSLFDVIMRSTSVLNR